VDIQVSNHVFLRVKKSPNPKASIWLIHGFGESGLCYKEAFSSKLCNAFDLYAVDLPGFGVSPAQNSCQNIAGTAQVLRTVIQELSQNQPLIFIGHSMGGIIGTALCKMFPNQVQYFFSVEGNLTKADTFLSKLTLDYNDPSKFYDFYIKKIYKKLESGDPVMHCYYASVRFCDPQTLLSMGRSCYEETGETKAGEEFNQLNCKKLYLWGDQSTPKETFVFIQEKKIPNYCFKGSHHWPMLDNTQAFYEKILESL